ncbi:SnoaL-like domain containing protein [Leishmania donovani]|uniref:SnoaL-like_domain_containing_protein_-_putative n=3 Tax=Leishmania donovani species complex TaxID=38574 RepID=A0A6L0XW72_LEIIN|nr:conserved hypothetical protein [Leishmania infantum JPCM5]TPP43165.1 SnoaL-like domain family protein [Leishmania donovani]CAC9516397.1 SnoaL-like_domain_containing_protein_-_putative [Leishmania infantum]CAJ1991166.1 SnoaL-like domain containing protein [Leishmania donovani]CAM70280.1 conserved hypothetical protein [Leishmania infantum JPCM5]SUZ44192.1 SnoaL-like_domain_containing_protein_-_putative [Leishmania infantum]|eukprot:XP_001467227.1 conserved hypothetical protein [Leishmania infantum JPCM5]
MTASHLVLQRYTDLINSGDLDAAFNYLSEDIIYVTWLGVVEGKDNVVTFLRDNIRFLHFTKSFNRWRQVQHCLDADLCRRFDDSGVGDSNLFDRDGYDPQGYASFERDGMIANVVKYSMQKTRVKETVVIRDNKVVLVTLMEQL